MTSLATAIIDQAARAAARRPRDIPILFQEDMIRAERAGAKTVTRRLKGLDTLNAAPDEWTFDRWQDGYPDGRIRAVFFDQSGEPIGIACPYGQRGDRLWVKETWCLARGLDSVAPSQVNPPDREHHAVHYLADGPKPDWAGKTRVSIHMPRWVSRTTLEVVEVRVERLNQISEKDACAEGAAVDWERVDANGGSLVDAVYPCPACSGDPKGIASLCHPIAKGRPWGCVYANLWDAINPTVPWASNPWVWCIRFSRLQPPTPKGP